MSTILDFQIQPLSTESYYLTVCERGLTQPLASASFSHRVDFLTDFSVDRLNASTKDAGDRFDELQKLGRELYQKLFPPAIEQVWREYKQRSEFLILCLRFAEDAKKLEVLPWETLYDSGSKEFIAAGAKTTLTRLPLGVAPPDELPPIPRPLRLFGFFASPLDLGDHERLNAEREQEILLEAINNPAGQGRISADFEDEAKLEILERSLRANSGGYHILHFTGHGINPRDGGGLLLEDAHGKKLPASIDEVMQAVKSGVDKLRLAVISGCQTARTLHTGAFSDLARELLRQRVPAVIAMQFSISDEGGLKFAEVLYREIAKGVELERAVYAARRVLLEDKRFFINNDALAIVLLAADGACLQTTEAHSLPPQAELGATYLGDRLDPLAHGFYGRRREYRKLRDGLQQDQRAVIIHGIGGIGKTALLTHAIHRLRPRFKDVMSFDCRRAALAPETILLELHRYFATQGMPQLQSLIGQNVPPETVANEISKLLTQWPLLIVFDNFESQLDEHRKFINEDLRVFLTTLVRATATGSRFLFTARYVFNLDSERLNYLPLGDLSRPEALMLMQKLPNLAQAAYRDKLAVLEKFGGHPYALITLDRHCSHQPLNKALQDASSLKSGLREFLAIELNYRRLTDTARELLNRLSAFRIGVPVQAAIWVMGEKDSRDAAEYLNDNRDKFTEQLNEIGEEALLQILSESLPEIRRADNIVDYVNELTHSGLLTPQVEDDEHHLMAIHSLVRDFCCDQQPCEAWRERLRDAANFFINQARLIRQDDKSPAIVWGEIEALMLLIEAEDFTDAANVLLAADPLLVRWGYSRFVEHQYLRLLNKVEHRTAAPIILNLGVLLQNRGDYEQANRHYQLALKIAEGIDHRVNIAASHHQIGSLHQVCGKLEQALEHFRHSLVIAEELGHLDGIAKSVYSIGLLHDDRGDYEQSLAQYQRALKIWEELNNRIGIASSLNQIGRIYRLRGNYEQALKQHQRSLKIKEELGNLSGIAHSFFQMSLIHYDLGEYEQALAQCQSAMKLWEELNYPVGIASSLHQFGMIYQNFGDYEQAIVHYQRALKISEELGDRNGAANSHGQLALLFAEIGRYVDAFEHLLFALDAFVELQSPKAGNVVNDLRNLRVKWGMQKFDEAWLQTMDEDVPDWLKKSLDERQSPHQHTTREACVRGWLRKIWRR